MPFSIINQKTPRRHFSSLHHRRTADNHHTAVVEAGKEDMEVVGCPGIGLVVGRLANSEVVLAESREVVDYNLDYRNLDYMDQADLAVDTQGMEAG